ncbi:uncharacterized protein [Ptychodera flava]|uniref:uncharacterized protein n=1 Tax=Ptychodera flava TaxID=63121 RepID=UPI00396A79F8
MRFHLIQWEQEVKPLHSKIIIPNTILNTKVFHSIMNVGVIPSIHDKSIHAIPSEVEFKLCQITPDKIKPERLHRIMKAYWIIRPIHGSQDKCLMRFHLIQWEQEVKLLHSKIIIPNTILNTKVVHPI